MKFVLAALLFIAMSWAVSNGNEESDDGSKGLFQEKLANLTEHCIGSYRIQQKLGEFLDKVKECREEDGNLGRQDGAEVRGNDAAVGTGQSTERQREGRESPLERVHDILGNLCGSDKRDDIKMLLRRRVQRIKEERDCERNEVTLYLM